MLTRAVIFSTMTACGVRITTEFPDQYQLCLKSVLRPVTGISLSYFDGGVGIMTMNVYNM